ncbi:MAG: alanine--tRNA ligase [Candidatus Baltobacteraceae bacterium]
MTSQELRASFVDFFISKGHRHLAPASLIPDAMSTTLFTIAGMEQFVPVFLGEAPAPAPRAVTVQRCLRVAGAKSDIENVGRTGRHGTFLEMLGNFSFGDYYKREAILFAWEYLTQQLKLDEDRLFVTIHTSDDEAARLWEYEVGLVSSRITRFDEDNFWTMGATGPCGPCSEIFYDNGAAHASGPDDRGPNLGARFVEIWNLVFQQFNRTSDGTLSDLPRTAIDTGAGFERMLAAGNGKASMYETDLFVDLVAAQPSAVTNFAPGEALVRRRIIADHARATTFLVADGVAPSNTDRGYVLRFLIRRAVRNGRLLGYPSGFLAELVGAVVTSLAPGYPALLAERSRVAQTIGAEEAAFERTLERGSEMLDRLIAQAKTGAATIAGTEVFTLHDTFGFPSELTREIANEADVDVDMAGFSTAMEEQRERAREDAARKRRVVSHASEADAPSGFGASSFEGYEGLETEGTVGAILVEGKPVDAIVAGDEAQIVLDRTSFYAEQGGQIGDRGNLKTEGASFEVADAQHVGDAIAHAGTVREGKLAVGDRVRTTVSSSWREEIRRHHTSAHLLQRALKDVLGEEIAQAGSWVGADRMRFDFRSSGGALSTDQRRRVAARVNELIRADYPRRVRELPIAEALKTGAITMAGEKYGERVRVMEFGPSVEFCGGTHAHSTGELGLFVMLAESSIGSGIRRIEGIVSKAAESYVTAQQDLVGTLAETLSSQPEVLVERVGRLQAEVRDLQRALAEIRARLAASDAQAYAERAETVAGYTLVAAVVREANAEATRSLANAIRSRLASGAIALVGIDGDAVALFLSVSPDLVARGVHAGNLLKRAAASVDARGGGGAAQAQGGGRNAAGAQAALVEIRAALAE